MTSVVLVLSGPMQSWGGPAPGPYERNTDQWPSMSGVVGTIANALGRERTDSIDDLVVGNKQGHAKLTVRRDRRGTLARDYHTIGTAGRYAIKADGSKGTNSIPTERWYIHDAAFLSVWTPPVGGVSADEVLEALKSPARPLYLGRRGCVPSSPIGLCVTELDHMGVIRALPVLSDPPKAADAETVDYFDGTPVSVAPRAAVMVERDAQLDEMPGARLRADLPRTFDPRRTGHDIRRVVTESVDIPVNNFAGRGPAGLRRLMKSSMEAL